MYGKFKGIDGAVVDDDILAEIRDTYCIRCRKNNFNEETVARFVRLDNGSLIWWHSNGQIECDATERREWRSDLWKKWRNER
jgi:hypothetical protein